MAQYYEKIGYQLNIDGKYYNNLDIDAFSLMMKNPSYCYKFYWLEAIVQLISEDVKETSFNEIIDEMIANAWYTVLEFHIHLSGMIEGQIKDGLERAILTLQELSKLPANASKVEIKNGIKEYDKELTLYKEQLTHMVPYRALSGFFDKCQERADWGSTQRMVSYIERVNQISLLPYTLGAGSSLNKEVFFHEAWIKMIQDNTVPILGWIQYEKVKWLQNNNPEVPGLIYKLAPMNEKMRKLNSVRKLWKAVMDNQSIVDVFKNSPIVNNNYDVDHFIPWSFVMNDELWNLMPMDSALNSSKSNKLPKWDPFFRRFASNQFILYSMIHDDRKPEIRKKYESCYRDNLHSIWANQELYRKGNSKEEFYNILEKNMQPVYDSARRQGYQIW
ncbi:HNH endonuclease domain-containing protein [Clostridium boliviensis]|uniref:HNH endonuclease domain-containing protein n=1 Tax=Clostridium boliviensis TaxID=318465 RepID=A0ABU4GEW5_9CLOT|nr:HNH endonuclease domain-containing protein [Clostridium boliviensis]MDW2796164.1 HNH endonuclease domain-containing protein [Clostridium boliviensis]